MVFLDSVIHQKLSDCFSTFSHNYLRKYFFTLQLSKIFFFVLNGCPDRGHQSVLSLFGNELCQITLNLCIIFSIPSLM
jgi:hypothetical protein